MKYLVLFAALLGFAVPALASEQHQPSSKSSASATDQRPVTLSDEQLDNVSGGALVSGVNVQALNNVTANVQANVAAAVNANVLGSATQGAAPTATQNNPLVVSGQSL